MDGEAVVLTVLHFIGPDIRLGIPFGPVDIGGLRGRGIGRVHHAVNAAFEVQITNGGIHKRFGHFPSHIARHSHNQ